MTNLLHIEPDALEDFRLTLFKRLQAIGATWQQINADVITLQQGGWQGQGADSFYEEMHTVRLALEDVVDCYTRTIEELGRVVQRFEEVDSELAGMMAKVV